MREARGFTLIELMIVVSLTALLLLVGAPQLTTLIRSVRVTSATNRLFSHMQLARGEAVKRNSRVVLCNSIDGLSCAGIDSWQQGWIVFHDANHNGLVDAGELLIQREEAFASDIKITGNVNVAKYVSFTPTGVGQLGTFTICHVAMPSDARQISININGRPRIKKASGC